MRHLFPCREIDMIVIGRLDAAVVLCSLAAGDRVGF